MGIAPGFVADQLLPFDLLCQNEKHSVNEIEVLDTPDSAPDLLGLSLAQLSLWVDARGTGFRLKTPPAYHRFLIPPSQMQPGDLLLRVHAEKLPEKRAWGACLCYSEIWELWRDDQGSYVFYAPRQVPPRQIVVAPDFSRGVVQGDFSLLNGTGFYPIQSLDIRLLANWLAKSGDIILHAAGVEIDGRGYCFAGASGVGKSTLAATLSSSPQVTVLGEDQVILRYLDGQFYIFGTPFHMNPDLCSPRGAPLEKVFFLEKNGSEGVGFFAPIDGVTRLLQTAFIPYYLSEMIPAILDRLASMAERVPFSTFSYRIGSNVLDILNLA